MENPKSFKEIEFGVADSKMLQKSQGQTTPTWCWNLVKSWDIILTISTGNCRISEPSTIVVMWYCCLLLYLGVQRIQFDESTLPREHLVFGGNWTPKTLSNRWNLNRSLEDNTNSSCFASHQPSRHEHGNKILDPKSRSKYWNHTTLVTQDEICGISVKCFVTSTSCHQHFPWMSKCQIQWSFWRDPLFS